jgi:uncharacterized membrane protein HdeD (DUF308 family)
MIVIVRRFSERWPRAYGLIMLALGISLAFLSQHIARLPIAFFALFMSVAFGVAGIFYIAFGLKAHRFDVRYAASHSLDRPTSRDIGLGVVLLAFTGLLFWLLRL